MSDSMPPDPVPAKPARKRPKTKVGKPSRATIVEAMIRKEGWSEETVGKLIRKTGWSRRTLFRERDRLAVRLADEEAATLPGRRALFLIDVRGMRQEARKAGKFSPAARLLEMEGRVLGLDQAAPPPEDGDASLESVLATTRRMRQAAEAVGSFVAADKLLGREAELVEAIRRRDEDIAARERRHLDADGLVDQIAAVSDKLPPALRAKLRAALGDT